MNPQDVQRVLQDFADNDGMSLRDIYVFETDAAGWLKLLSGLASEPWGLEVEINGGHTHDFTRIVDVLRDPDQHGCASLTVSGAIVTCTFFVEEEVELNLDRREWSAGNIEALFDFVRFVGTLLDRNVYVTDESAPEHCVFAYRCEDGSLEVLASPAG